MWPQVTPSGRPASRQLHDRIGGTDMAKATDADERRETQRLGNRRVRQHALSSHAPCFPHTAFDRVQHIGVTWRGPETEACLIYVNSIQL